MSSTSTAVTPPPEAFPLRFIEFTGVNCCDHPLTEIEEALGSPADKLKASLDRCPLSGEVQIQAGRCAAFSNWNRLVTVLCGRRSNTAPAASKCYNRPNDADSWRNHKNIFAGIFPLKSKA
jgi:hypothetical protein